MKCLWGTVERAVNISDMGNISMQYRGLFNIEFFVHPFLKNQKNLKYFKAFYAKWIRQ